MAHGQGVRPPYWSAARLTATARARWHEFDGWAASCGVDPLDLPIDRFLNLVYYWLMQGVKPSERDRVEAQLAAPPSGADPAEVEEDPDSPWSADAEMAAFRAAQSATSS